MRDDSDERPGPLAQSLLAASRVVDLRDDANETAALVREILALPTLPSDLTEREAALAMLIWKKTDIAKRILALVAMP